jgi:hypothetical protein
MDNRKKALLAILIFSVLILSGCALIPDKPATVKGSGNVISETRAVAGFKSISLEGSADVNVDFGTAEALTIRGEDNIVFLIETNVQNGQLVINTKPQMTYTATVPVVINVTMIALDRVSISGSGNINVPDFAGDALVLDLPGSGNIIIGGTANRVDITLGGSGNIFTDQLKAKTATADLSGAGNIKVFASDKLDATLSGSGDIQYSGNPASVNKKVTGVGSIHE